MQTINQTTIDTVLNRALAADTAADTASAMLRPFYQLLANEYRALDQAESNLRSVLEMTSRRMSQLTDTFVSTSSTYTGGLGAISEYAAEAERHAAVVETRRAACDALAAAIATALAAEV